MIHRRCAYLIFFSVSLLAGIPLRAASDLPANVTIITKEEFRGRNVYSVADALRGVTSLNIAMDGSRGTRATARARGFSAEKTLVLLDGRPLTHEFDNEVDLAQFPITLVERIEISRGGSSVAYSGQAPGAVINIITPRPNEKGLNTELGTDIGRDGYKNLEGVLLGHSFWADVTYTGSKQVSNGFGDNEDFEGDHHFINLSRSFNGKGFWGAEYYFQETKVGLSNGTTVPFDNWEGRNERLSVTPHSERRQISQHAKIQLGSPEWAGGNFFFDITQAYRDLSDYAVRGGPEVVDESFRTNTVNLKYRRGEFETGLQNRQLYRSLYLQEDHRGYERSFYALQKFSTGRWLFLPGFRLDGTPGQDLLFNPRANAVFNVNEHWAFSAGATRGFKAPSFDELYLDGTTLSNAELKAERFTSYDAGIMWTNKTMADLKVNGFYTRNTDAIAADTSNRWRNEGLEEVSGAEIQGRLETGGTSTWFHYTLSGGWTYQRARLKTPISPGFVDSALSPRRIAFARLDHHFPRGITLRHDVEYKSDQFELQNRAGLRIPSSYHYDISIHIEVLKADLYIAAQNITGRRYAETIATPAGFPTLLSPQPERTYWAGLNMRFKN